PRPRHRAGGHALPGRAHPGRHLAQPGRADGRHRDRRDPAGRATGPPWLVTILQSEVLMKLNLLLILAAIYLALIGLGYLLVPDALLFGTLAAGAAAPLLANLRGVASTFFGIAVVNWLARNAEPSTARNAIIVANVVGFGIA